MSVLQGHKARYRWGLWYKMDQIRLGWDLQLQGKAIRGEWEYKGMARAR